MPRACGSYPGFTQCWDTRGKGKCFPVTYLMILCSVNAFPHYCNRVHKQVSGGSHPLPVSVEVHCMENLPFSEHLRIVVPQSHIVQSIGRGLFACTEHKQAILFGIQHLLCTLWKAYNPIIFWGFICHQVPPNPMPLVIFKKRNLRYPDIAAGHKETLVKFFAFLKNKSFLSGSKHLCSVCQTLYWSFRWQFDGCSCHQLSLSTCSKINLQKAALECWNSLCRVWFTLVFLDF